MTRKFQRLSHSIYECKYQIVFCPKYRYRILKNDVEEYTRQQVYRLCQQKDKVEVLELNVQADRSDVNCTEVCGVGHYGIPERKTGDEAVPTV